MTSNETKLQNLRDYLDTLIGEYREAITSSLRAMEKFNISPEDFRKESVNLNVAVSFPENVSFPFFGLIISGLCHG